MASWDQDGGIRGVSQGFKFLGLLKFRVQGFAFLVWGLGFRGLWEVPGSDWAAEGSFGLGFRAFCPKVDP